jgi:hypothetical protein
MKTKFFQLLSVVAIATVSFNSCTTDACKDVDCGLYGECVDGDCVCDSGYEGVNCETLTRAEFLGTFNVAETCSASDDTYAVVIAAGSTATAVTITNLYDAGLVVNGTVNVDGGITIASQSFGTGTISGSVTRTGGVTTINFTITVAGDSDTCSAVSQ